ncbi:MAG: 1-acyl-sn-glycerol-3-phosphate acyltransferase [Oligoflexia bacterium]|nr:1-acyl-sn-glycerol-3-phosphate acyltransferase [Oligoflexia bacterium]
MENSVKNKQDSQVDKLHFFWVLYLTITSVFFTIFYGWLIVIIRVLKSKDHKYYLWTYSLQCYGIKNLLKAQPWLTHVPQINIPDTDRKVILVSNHRSHLDVFFYLSQIKRLRVVAKVELFKAPILGHAMRIIHQIPIEKGNMESFQKASEIMTEGMRESDRVLFFPELTRSEPRLRDTRKFSLIPFTLAIKENALVIPLVAWNTDSLWPKGKIGISYKKTFKMFSLPPIDSCNFTSANSLKQYVQERINEALKSNDNKNTNLHSNV